MFKEIFLAIFIFFNLQSKVERLERLPGEEIEFYHFFIINSLEDHNNEVTQSNLGAKFDSRRSRKLNRKFFVHAIFKGLKFGYFSFENMDDINHIFENLHPEIKATVWCYYEPLCEEHIIKIH